MKGIRGIIAVLAMAAGVATGAAQSSFPAPGRPSGGGSGMPAPGRPAGPPPYPGPAWGSPWNSGWNMLPGAGWQNSGYATVMACGYDAQGVWRVLPLYVSYNYNGVQYDVTVVNAYNPWSDSWDTNVNMPAYPTSYYIGGRTYDFYAPLSTGTYYFNL